MAAHRSLLSPHSKAVIARELGVAELVDQHGWGAVPSRACGSVVRVALEHAERALAQHGPAPHGFAQHGFPQHGFAQHGFAQHGTEGQGATERWWR